MAKTISASNAVVGAVEAAAGLFGVRCYRMNSRTVSVIGAGGRERPMFMGQWVDRFGVKHNKGMADVLLTPFIPKVSMTGVLWVECKAGTGRLSPDQKEFRDDVIEGGAYYIEAHDGPDEVIEWFKTMGVRR